MVSAKMLNNFAFFVLSLTMLGFAASGAWLSRNVARWRRASGRRDCRGRRAASASAWWSRPRRLYPSPPVEDWASGSRAGFLLGFLSVRAAGAPLRARRLPAAAWCWVLCSRLPPCRPADSTRSTSSAPPAGRSPWSPRSRTWAPSVRPWAPARCCSAAAALLAPPRARRGAADRWRSPARPSSWPSSRRTACSACATRATRSWGARSRRGRALRARTRRVGTRSRASSCRACRPRRPRAAPGHRCSARTAGCWSRFRLVITQNNNAFTYAPAWDGNPRDDARPRARPSTRAAYQREPERRARACS